MVKTHHYASMAASNHLSLGKEPDTTIKCCIFAAFVLQVSCGQTESYNDFSEFTKITNLLYYRNIGEQVKLMKYYCEKFLQFPVVSERIS